MSGLLSDRELNTIRGKTLVGHNTKDETMRVFMHVDALEELLDKGDDLDAFGTTGWREYAGKPK